jgi:hypothetical protein
MNAGWAEWLDEKLPTHATEAVTDFSCSCSDPL